MNILVLGLGVIGTTYGYAFKTAGHQVEHFLRDKKRENSPKQIQLKLLDGRFDRKGAEYSNIYEVDISKENSEYDFILISVTSGKLKDAVKSLKSKNIKGTLILFCNFWDTRLEIEQIVDDYPYIIGFPTAGGYMNNGKLNCVLFDHIMLEREDKTSIKNYSILEELLKSSGIKTEKPFDMIEWIWIHMAINAGVTTTAAKKGNLENPKQLAINLMDNSKALAETVLSIRETIEIVKARGVDAKLYKNEIIAYKIPRHIAGILMKYMFKNNELTRRIMTLHNDVDDILYGCKSVYKTGKRLNVIAPNFYNNFEEIGQIVNSTRCL